MNWWHDEEGARSKKDLLTASLCATADAIAFDYTAERSKAIKACETIDSSDSQSSLFLNPDGYRSYYVRSKCFQEAAVTFRDPVLCEEVTERRSLLSSSWATHPNVAVSS